MGDAYGCGIVEHLSRDELKKLDEDAEREFGNIINQSNKQQNFDEPISIHISDETDNNPKLASNTLTGKFADFNKFEGSQLSINKLQPQPQSPPSIVVMDAVRRRSRVLLFNTKLPTSVYSMPQISQFANNDDSNV